MSKEASVLLGLAAAGVGAWQMVSGIRACTGRREPHWSAQRAASLAVGDFTVSIPAGWRDAREASDSEIKELVANSPRARILIRETFDGDLVTLLAAPSEPVVTPAPCEKLVTDLVTVDHLTASNITQRSFGVDPGCAWIAKANTGLEISMAMRFHGAQILLAGCPRTSSVCDRVLGSATPTK